MANVKGKGQRLIPEELLKYLEALKKKYPEAVDIVEANPTLEGGEGSLESVLINGVKYAVGGGSSATVRHSLTLSMQELGSCVFLIENNDSTPFTKSSLNTWLENHGYIDSGAYMPVVMTSIGSWGYCILGITKPTGYSSSINASVVFIDNSKLAFNGTTFGATSTLTDTVTQI